VDQFDERFDPRGRSYYWLAGEVVNDFEAAGSGPKDWATDVAQVQGGGVALTPLQPELFWRGALPPLPITGLSGAPDAAATKG
jgi:5'-nucleotidase